LFSELIEVQSDDNKTSMEKNNYQEAMENPLLLRR